MKDARPQYASRLDFVQIEDFADNTNFEEAVDGIDAIVHTASVSWSAQDEPRRSAYGRAASNLQHHQ